MQFLRNWRIGLVLVIGCLAAHSAAAITITVDYTYDLPANGGSNFFAAGNPQGATGGAQATAALEAAASYLSTVLTDTFDPINVPAPYHSTAQGSTGTITWSWSVNFQHPSNNAANQVTVINPTISTDQYRVYVGGRSLAGDRAGLGGFGGYTTASTTLTGTNSFTPGDNANITSLTTALNQAITTRGEPSGFSRWGGAIAFDNDGTTQWFFNHLADPSGSLTDFYSVALHELTHTLGFGGSTQWTSLVENNRFVGVNAENQYGGNTIPVATSPNQGHWDFGVQSVVYGTSTSQETLMDPDITVGTRKKFTALDAGALQDIGWSLGPPPASPAVNGDYNNNGVVDAGDYAVWRKRNNQDVTLPNDTTPGTVRPIDYTVWRTNFGKTASGSGSGALLANGEVPEPASGLLALMLAMCVYFYRSQLLR
jgi:hypothetical protein